MTDNNYQLSDRNLSLVIKKVTNEMAGIYFCDVIDQNRENVGRVVRGLNIVEHLYRDLLDKVSTTQRHPGLEAEKGRVGALFTRSWLFFFFFLVLSQTSAVWYISFSDGMSCVMLSPSTDSSALCRVISKPAVSAHFHPTHPSSAYTRCHTHTCLSH